MATHPNSTTHVTANAVSACLARMTGDMATTAVQPQTAVPMASKTPRRVGTLSNREMTIPATNAVARHPSATGSAVTAIADAPASVSRNPTSAIPVLSSRCMAQLSPSLVQAGTPSVFRHSMPRRTAYRTGLRGIFGSPTAPCATPSDMLLARTARRMATSTPGTTRRREIQPGPSAVRRARTQQAPRSGGVLLGNPELTMRSKINFLGYNAAIRDHGSMQLRYGLAAGLDEQEREDCVHEAGACGQ